MKFSMRLRWSWASLKNLQLCSNWTPVGYVIFLLADPRKIALSQRKLYNHLYATVVILEPSFSFPSVLSNSMHESTVSPLSNRNVYVGFVSRLCGVSRTINRQPRRSFCSQRCPMQIEVSVNMKVVPIDFKCGYGKNCKASNPWYALTSKFQQQVKTKTASMH